MFPVNTNKQFNFSKKYIHLLNLIAYSYNNFFVLSVVNREIMAALGMKKKTEINIGGFTVVINTILIGWREKMFFFLIT